MQKQCGGEFNFDAESLAVDCMDYEKHFCRFRIVFEEFARPHESALFNFVSCLLLHQSPTSIFHINQSILDMTACKCSANCDKCTASGCTGETGCICSAKAGPCSSLSSRRQALTRYH